MKTNDEVMDILDKLKEENNLSISEIARRVDMAKSAVSKYFNRQRNFPLSRIEDFAQAMNVSPEYILGYEARSVYPEQETTSSRHNKITVVSETNETAYFPTNFSHLSKGQSFYFKMNDISMEPTIPKDATVLVKVQDEVKDDQFAAVTLNEDPTLLIKKVKKQESFLLLLSENPDYAPIIISEKDSIKIIGRAVRVSYEL
ncbi:XRE family transcriptional regulator [Tetragenococcus koreensis]|uniref:Repressor n=1 Tax=Tetragenococcus koreensis TaxID=290335 RepID=A0AAN4UDK4_9ENTE|nr:XRE family transcriptional regulator [Tetragenococcus koreensis]GEQ50289.1 repressor [Tetragenococcus koreensis]GEQ52776.1 repressor [Tetragenococcus koreensis]GEQ55524.1 repressor [Tetragenococcus koreensis]GEQ58021.1 repressor [Tetragenococcus koreensis]GEQ60515.1 repressor [Tetragenococcus koreensis]